MGDFESMLGASDDYIDGAFDTCDIFFEMMESLTEGYAEKIAIYDEIIERQQKLIEDMAEVLKALRII